MAKKLVLIDSHALIHRAYHAIPKLTVNGQHINAVYGFSNSIIHTLKELQPDYLILTFDEKGPTFRHDKYTDYKAKRPKTEPDLIAQFPVCRSLADAFGFPALAKPGLEADDLIGSLVKKGEQKDLEIIIVTGDKDSYQLISPQTSVYNLGRGAKYAYTVDLEEFKKQFPFEPKNLVDYKALHGDSSDNIPGVPGIGDKTAKELISKYQTIEHIYENVDCDNLTSTLEIKPRVLKALCENKESAFTSKDLATIHIDETIELDLESARVTHYDKMSAEKFMTELQFYSLVKRLPQSQSSGQKGMF